MYRAVTRQIEVTVEPNFMPERSSVDQGQYFWAYTIVITNTGEETVQLRTRHWIITDATGHRQEVRGEGVVGEQPVLAPGERFEYTCGVPLPTSSGFMTGRYQMVTESGEQFEIDVPTFSLDSPDEKRVLNWSARYGDGPMQWTIPPMALLLLGAILIGAHVLTPWSAPISPIAPSSATRCSWPSQKGRCSGVVLAQISCSPRRIASQPGEKFRVGGTCRRATMRAAPPVSCAARRCRRGRVHPLYRRQDAGSPDSRGAQARKAAARSSSFQRTQRARI